MFATKQQIIYLSLVCTAVTLAMVADKATAIDPLVVTGVSELSPDGKHVSVNVPAILSMNLDTRGNHNGARLSGSILGGLIKIDMDRVRGDDGKLHGPLKVTVGGITMYDNGETAPSA